MMLNPKSALLLTLCVASCAAKGNPIRDVQCSNKQWTHDQIYNSIQKAESSTHGRYPKLYENWDLDKNGLPLFKFEGLLFEFPINDPVYTRKCHNETHRSTRHKDSRLTSYSA